MSGSALGRGERDAGTGRIRREISTTAAWAPERIHLRYRSAAKADVSPNHARAYTVARVVSKTRFIATSSSGSLRNANCAASADGTNGTARKNCPFAAGNSSSRNWCEALAFHFAWPAFRPLISANGFLFARFS
jgi:hypothetical protein